MFEPAEHMVDLFGRPSPASREFSSEAARLIYESEQRMIPLMKRDCPWCNGTTKIVVGYMPAANPLHAACWACRATGTYSAVVATANELELKDCGGCEGLGGREENGGFCEECLNELSAASQLEHLQERIQSLVRDPIPKRFPDPVNECEDLNRGLGYIHSLIAKFPNNSCVYELVERVVMHRPTRGAACT